MISHKTLYISLLSPYVLHVPPNSFFSFGQPEFFYIYWLLSSSLCCFLHSPISSSLFFPNILLSTLFSNTLSLRSSLNLSDELSHPHKTKKKVYSFLCLNLNIFGKECWKTYDLAPNGSKRSLTSVCSYYVPEFEHFRPFLWTIKKFRIVSLFTGAESMFFPCNICGQIDTNISTRMYH